VRFRFTCEAPRALRYRMTHAEVVAVMEPLEIEDEDYEQVLERRGRRWAPGLVLAPTTAATEL
jgi:hypothetical protein